MALPASAACHEEQLLAEALRLRTPSPENSYAARHGVLPPAPHVLLPHLAFQRPMAVAPVLVFAPLALPQGMACWPSTAAPQCGGEPLREASPANRLAETAQESSDDEVLELVDTDALIGYAKFGPGSGQAAPTACESSTLAGSTAFSDTCSEASSLGSDHSSLPDLELPEGVPSLGSLNHPHGCGRPCKYIKKAQGCKDQLSCTHCHLCVWHSRRDGKSKRARAPAKFCCPA